MANVLGALKKLATCFGCCECTEDDHATSKAEALDFICNNSDKVTSKWVRDIKLKVNPDGTLISGWWGDWAGHRHKIEIQGLESNEED